MNFDKPTLTVYIKTDFTLGNFFLHCVGHQVAQRPGILLNKRQKCLVVFLVVVAGYQTHCGSLAG